MARADRLVLLDCATREIPLRTQADLLSLNWSSLYYVPAAPSSEELQFKHRIDELYTARPVYGVRRITAQLRREGLVINHSLVWQDLSAVLTEPATVVEPLLRAQGGHWLPQELQAHRTTLHQGIASVERQQGRLLDAYLAWVIALAEFERKRTELDARLERLQAQERQLEALTEQQLELTRVGGSIEEFCAHVRTEQDQATFEERRALVELLSAAWSWWMQRSIFAMRGRWAEPDHIAVLSFASRLSRRCTCTTIGPCARRGRI